MKELIIILMMWIGGHTGFPIPDSPNILVKTQSEIINEKTAEFDALIDVNIIDHRDLLEADDLVLRSFNSLKNSLYSRLSVTLIRNNTAHTTVCSKYSQYKLWKQRQRVKTWVGHDGI